MPKSDAPMVAAPAPQTRALNRRQPPAGQARGAVLFVGLIILVIMTIVGISAMRGAALEERMAGNLKDKTDSLHAAEAAVQAALTAIEDNPQPLRAAPYGNRTRIRDGCRVIDSNAAAACSTPGDIPDDWLSAVGTLVSGALFKEYARNSRFGPAGAKVKDPATGAETDTDAWSQPRVQVQSRHTPTDLSFDAVGEQRGIIFFTVGAVASGPSGQSRTVLQTTIPKVYAW